MSYAVASVANFPKCQDCLADYGFSTPKIDAVEQASVCSIIRVEGKCPRDLWLSKFEGQLTVELRDREKNFPNNTLLLVKLLGVTHCRARKLMEAKQ